MSAQEFEEFDPLTGERFRVPVIASDGHTYELDELLKLMEQDKKESPYNRAILRPIALFHCDLADALSLPYPESSFFIIYDGPPVSMDSICADTLIGASVHLCMLRCVECEWLSLLFETKGLLSKKIRIDVILQQPESPGERPSVVGYPIAENLKQQLASFADTFFLPSMWSRTENLASCVLTVEHEGEQYEMCTLEELLNDKIAHQAWRIGQQRKQDIEASLRRAANESAL